MDGNELILLVEDTPDNEDLTRVAFEKNGQLSELVVARDGVEALSYLLNPGNPAPQLVLLDLRPPKANGLEGLRRLRESTRARFFPVAVMTSSKQESDLVSSYSLGCNSHIQKPVDSTHFVDAVRQMGLDIPAPQQGDR